MQNKQLEGLGNFFLDIAKGLLIGSVGTTTFTSIKLFTAVLGGLSAMGCVFTGLYFLGRMKE
ncbi:MAG: hypothetical protein AAB625_01040 [Patescibacteria group bacterium]